MGRGPLLALAGWFAAAALATLVGLAAIQVISAGITSETGEPQTAAEVARALAEASASPAGTPLESIGPSEPIEPTAVPSFGAPTASATSAVTSAVPSRGPVATRPAPVTRTFGSPGGSVRARCTGATVRLVSWAPAPGFGVHDVDRGPRREAKVDFRADDRRYRIEVRCSGGVPAGSVEDKS